MMTKEIAEQILREIGVGKLVGSLVKQGASQNDGDIVVRNRREFTLLSRELNKRQYYVNEFVIRKDAIQMQMTKTLSPETPWDCNFTFEIHLKKPRKVKEVSAIFKDDGAFLLWNPSKGAKIYKVT